MFSERASDAGRLRAHVNCGTVTLEVDLLYYRTSAPNKSIVIESLRAAD